MPTGPKYYHHVIIKGCLTNYAIQLAANSKLHVIRRPPWFASLSHVPKPSVKLPPAAALFLPSSYKDRYTREDPKHPLGCALGPSPYQRTWGHMVLALVSRAHANEAD